jgi:ABC-type transporter Mla subunit MlaD
VPSNLERLQATMAELHAQLEAVDDADPEVRALLHAALAELRGHLGAGAGRPAAHAEPLATRLGEAARRFEATHPDLAGAVGSVLDALARMGI